MSTATTDLDLSFRPSSYWKPTTVEQQSVSRITGHLRRALAQEWLDKTGVVPTELLQGVEKAGEHYVTPVMLGGEFLGELDDGEVEIARVSLESTTLDQVSVRARRDGPRIRYSIEDEYDSETLKQRWGPRSSKQPLTLAQLVKLIDSAYNVFRVLRDNLDGGADVDAMARFVTVTSEFYPELHELYARRIAAWFATHYSPDEAANDAADEDDEDDEVMDDWW